MAEVNMFIQYPLSDQMIALWTTTLHRLRPWCGPDHLQRTIDKFITGDFDWDPSKGIQNIFYGIHRTSKQP